MVRLISVGLIAVELMLAHYQATSTSFALQIAHFMTGASCDALDLRRSGGREVRCSALLPKRMAQPGPDGTVESAPRPHPPELFR